MRRNLLYLTVFAVLAMACSSDDHVIDSPETPSNEPHMITETITATYGDANNGTRADINGTNGAFTWSTNDQIAVHVSDGKYYNSSALASGGSSTATFSVSYPGVYSRDAFAVYPASIVSTSAANYGQSGKTLDVTLPSSYTLADVSDNKTPCPMIATNTGSGWTFKQLCGLLRVVVKNIPSGTSYLKVSFNGMKVSGNFSVASPVTPGTSTIASVAGTPGKDDYIKITGITTTGEVTVNIPLPTGTYTSFVVSAWNSSDAPLCAKVEAFAYTAQRRRAKKVDAALVPCKNLASLSDNYVATNGEILTGKLSGNYKVSIADKASVTLYDVTINGVDNDSYNWAGLTCEGDATIILEGTNNVKGFDDSYPGIQPGSTSKTLTITGTGSLNASSNGWGAGIGGGSNISCGNIKIEGGTITATGGEAAAGIGSGFAATKNVICGDITISGGTVTAKGGDGAAGIGSGSGTNASNESTCGSISIAATVTSVIATKGSGAQSIGAGEKYSSCGTITIADQSKVTQN